MTARQLTCLGFDSKPRWSATVVPARQITVQIPILFRPLDSRYGNSESVVDSSNGGLAPSSELFDF